MSNYKVGDAVVQWCFGLPETARIVIIERKLSVVKNGRAGFDGHLLGGLSVWGYDEDVQCVVPRKAKTASALMFAEDY